jgi:hypothetical protein
MNDSKKSTASTKGVPVFKTTRKATATTPINSMSQTSKIKIIEKMKILLMMEKIM